ncbi:MAG: DegT/DnrJ/EryC1/StrS aminotransferase family protein [Flavobacteriales bacterium]|jgi:dTDP-4-amino-4,6-dideoxygalactose transaminase|nr:DegT/DnrJ/EryC1/StrS aminotransferase family protein [Flavobacteriales bacterium]
MIPFSPPRIDDKTIASVTEALKSGWITTGPKTKKFEEEIAQYVGGDAVVALNSATAGLQLILHWLGIKEGDEVIVPAYTYCATANVVKHTGATPVMVDVNTSDFNINVEAVKKAITPRTKAIIPVDIGGLPVDYDALFAVVKSKEINQLFTPSSPTQQQMGRITIVSDSAHSIGASYKNKKAGMLADLSSFSFHAVKNLTTAEGGAVVFNVADKFNHSDLQKKFKTSSLHGQTKDAFSKMQVGAWRYDIVEAGFKCNMTDLQAAIGLVELGRYEETLAKRKYIFDYYSNRFKHYQWANIPVYETDDKISSYHLYLLRIIDCSETQRNEIIQKISEKEVAVNVHYLPLPMLSFYKNLNYKIENYPNAYNNYKGEISLPVWYNLTDEQLDIVATTVINAVEEVLAI